MEMSAILGMLGPHRAPTESAQNAPTGDSVAMGMIVASEGRPTNIQTPSDRPPHSRS